jgi:hypothetical protein
VRLRRPAGTSHDVVGLAAGVREPLAVLAQQLVGLAPGPLGRVDRLLDRALALVERLGDAREGDLPQHEHRQGEDDERPDHQPPDGIDEPGGVAFLGCQHEGHARKSAIRPETRP